MEVSVAFLGWKLDVESEKVGGCIGLWRLSKKKIYHLLKTVAAFKEKEDN